MSKSVKKIIGVVAAIAIPFAAPAIAGAILGSAAGVFATTATSAAVGAALGAGTAAVTGGDVGRGALFGGIGGGVGGFTAARAAQAAKAAQAAQAPGTAGGTLGAGGGAFVPGGTPPTVGLSTPAGGTLGEGGGAFIAGGTGAPATVTPAVAASTTAAGTTAAGATAAAAPKMTFLEALKAAPGKIAAKFSDPQALADLTLRAGAQLAGSAMSDTGLSSEERGLLAAQTEELRNLQQTNRDAFNLRMQEAMNLIGEARYFDPEYFGLQSARRAQLAVGRERQAGLRGLTGERRAAASRRYDIEAGRRTGTAYDVGYGQGVAGRLQTRQAGISAIPTEMSPTAFSGYTPLLAGYGTGYNRQRQQQGDIADLFGSFTGGYKSRQTGEQKEEEKV